MTECYQCMDNGLLEVPMKSQNGMVYDYMFQCTCQKGHYYKQLPTFDIRVAENREFLKQLANKNYKLSTQTHKTSLNEKSESNDG